jgi:hypothetical protein
MQADGLVLSVGKPMDFVRPRRADYEEFLHTPVGALRRYLDGDSRPLCAEAAAEDPTFRASLERRRCHYAGSRQDHCLPMNASALKQMTKNWDKILSTADVLRRLFAGGPVSSTGGLALGMRVAYAGACLPLFLLYRASDPMGDRQVPGFVSGLHKASIDIAGSCQLMLIESFKERPAKPPPPEEIVQAILDFVEREGLLIGQKGVCAGPPQLIRELLDAMLHGRGRRLDEGSAAVGQLGDLRPVRLYVDELVRIWVGRHLVVAYNGRLMDRLEERLRAAGAGAWRAAELDARIREHRARESHPALVSKVIARQEQALRSLDAAQYGSLLRAIELAAGGLARPAQREPAQREPARALLEHAGADPGSAEQIPALARLRRVLESGVSGRTPDLVLGALLAAARMEQLALRFFASTEPNIRAALGLSGASRPLSSEDLSAVFGPSPRQHLAASVGIESSVQADRIEFRVPGGVVAFQQTYKEMRA